MSPTEYRIRVLETDKTLLDGSGSRLLHGALGLAGETGEVVDLIKKKAFGRQNIRQEKILEECGDVLWYMTILLDALGYTLTDAMKANIAKLETRYSTGRDEATEAQAMRKALEE